VCPTPVKRGIWIPAGSHMEIPHGKLMEFPYEFQVDLWKESTWNFPDGFFHAFSIKLFNTIIL
jgi:hypothetical protein